MDQLDTLRHSRERERGYTALELVAMMRSIGLDAETDRVSEEELWAMALTGEQPLVLVQNDLHARAFPNDYHWVLVEGTDAERERYRVYLADRRGASAWWGRERLARYHARGEGIVIIPGREEP